MIDFDSLRDISSRITTEPPFTDENIYVDLILTITLKRLQEKFDFLILKGGTAIVKAHFYPYRFSYDLDFSYFGKDNPKKQYKEYKESLKKYLQELGFKITNIESEDMHRDGGRILILKIKDKGSKPLQREVKVSISAIDRVPCYPPILKSFKTIQQIPSDPFEMLYPDIYAEINEVKAKVLSIEELCAEKIRALATRGNQGEWNLVLRDLVDLGVMDSKRVLNRVLNDRVCIDHKFNAITNLSYREKFESFLNSNESIIINEEDKKIFIQQDLFDESKLTIILNKIKDNLKKTPPFV
ncbi:MAG: nucleotidyl transferase AbiEii/AbiGii toxin family protein [Candidatus Micrarchaeia archaeon]|jgi:predicted nucleotidyltransferase component of viral defense system